MTDDDLALWSAGPDVLRLCTGRGQALIDRELHLPKSWIGDRTAAVRQRVRCSARVAGLKNISVLG